MLRENAREISKQTAGAAMPETMNSRLTQLELDVADMKVQLGKLCKKDGGQGGEVYEARVLLDRQKARMRRAIWLCDALLAAELALAVYWTIAPPPSDFGLCDSAIICSLRSDG